MATCPNFEVTFDLDPQSSTAGKFILEDTTDLSALGISASDLEGAFTIEYPDGTNRVGNVLTSPDIDKDVSSTYSQIDIPTDSNGEYLEGTYKFTYNIQVSGTTVQCTQKEKSFDFCPETPDSATLDLQANCFCTELDVTDNTDYGNYDSLTRSYEVTPPPNTGQSSKTFSSKSFTYTFTHTGYYYVSVDNAVTYVDGAFTIKDRLKDSSNVTQIKCDVDLCGLYDCIVKFFNDLDKKSGRLGGFSELPAEDLDDYYTVSSLIKRFDVAINCQKWSKATEFYNSLKDIVDCGCAEDSSNENRKITPVCGSTSSGNDIDINGGSNVNVSSSTSGGTTTYTISLAQSLINSINQNTTNLSNLAIDLTVGTDNFNSNVSSKAVISVTKTKSGFDWDFEINLVDPEDWHDLGNDSSPSGSSLYDNTQGKEILYLGATSQSDKTQTVASNISGVTGKEPKVRRTVTGYVEMEGIIKVGNGLTDSQYFEFSVMGDTYHPLFRAPTEYRPDQYKYFACAHGQSDDVQGWVRVSPNGDVAFISTKLKSATDVDTLISLENVYFYAEQ